MKKVKIVGVPEHFNLPWHLAIEEGAFEDRGIDLEWQDVPEGTGRMCELLKEGKTDLAIILTEGIIKAIAHGNPSKVLQEYVASPLLWGIHVGAASTMNTVEALEGKTAAISRYGSGSHLMAFVHASQKGWDLNGLNFELVHNLPGAVDHLGQHLETYFLWERFTTKPLVDSGVFKHLGDIPTPWPCFVIAGTQEFVQREKALVSHMLQVINTVTQEFKQIPSISRTLANRYGQQLSDIEEWLSHTRWSQKQLSQSTLKEVQGSLKRLGLIDGSYTAEHFLTTISS